MPVNEDGVEVHEDGSEIAPEELETSDWTNVIKLMENDNVKPLDMEILAPTSVPHNILYLEIYRTDEVYFKDYESPFLSNSGNTALEPIAEESVTGANETMENSAEITASNVGSSVKSSKTKNSKMANEILSVVKNNYKSSAYFDTLVERYMTARTNKLSINAVTERSHKHLKDSSSISSLDDAILRIKKKYG